MGRAGQDGLRPAAAGGQNYPVACAPSALGVEDRRKPPSLDYVSSAIEGARQGAAMTRSLIERERLFAEGPLE